MTAKNTKFLILTMVLMTLVTLGAFAQLDAAAGEPDPTQLGIDSAQQKLIEVSVSKFEDPAFWYPAMPVDQGVVETRRFNGSPLEKEVLEAEIKAGVEESDDYVLGAKVGFYRRGVNHFSVHPIRPIPIEGITKVVSVWVCGRNTKHRLVLLLKDYNQKKVEVDMGLLNFSGWKKLSVAIPPSIVQRDYHYNNQMGVSFTGFRIDCDIDETYGQYFIYFDDLRAVTDLFAEENRDADDMLDVW